MEHIQKLIDQIGFPEFLVDTRRDFFKKMVMGSAGVSLGSLAGCAGLSGSAKLGKVYSPTVGDSRVSLVKGSDRRDNIYEALKPFEQEIKDGIRGKQVVIKLNCVGQNGLELMVSHPDAVRGILDFLKPIHDGTVLVAESAVQNKGVAPWYEMYEYSPLEQEYNAKVVELNNTPTTWQWILDKDLYPIKIRVINHLLDPDNFVFSLTRLKTHNSVVVTLSLKNVVMGAPLKLNQQNINEKSKMHGGGGGNVSQKLINFNIFRLAQKVRPDFAVLDGLVGVEGNGPANGDPVEHGVALAGPDFLSVDRIGSELMGVPFADIGYLNYCATAGLGQGDRSKIKILGPDPKDLVIKYKLRDNIEQQMRWDDDLMSQDEKKG